MMIVVFRANHPQSSHSDGETVRVENGSSGTRAVHAVGAVRAMPGNRATAGEPCDARWTGPRRAKQAAAGGPVHADRTGRWADRPPGGADHTGRARCAATPAGTDAPAAGLFGGASFGQARNAWAAPGRLQGRAASVWA